MANETSQVDSSHLRSFWWFQDLLKLEWPRRRRYSRKTANTRMRLLVRKCRFHRTKSGAYPLAKQYPDLKLEVTDGEVGRR